MSQCLAYTWRTNPSSDRDLHFPAWVYKEVEKALVATHLQVQDYWLIVKHRIAVIGLMKPGQWSAVVQECAVVWLCHRVDNSPSALLFSQRCFFASVCMSVPLWWCHKTYGRMPTGKPAVCLESRESKGMMIVFRTRQYEAEEDGSSSAELQNSTEYLLQYRVEVTCLKFSQSPAFIQTQLGCILWLVTYCS